jgi:hypothetical protein
MNPMGCPLYKAIREQLPEFPLKSVGGLGVTTTIVDTGVPYDSVWGYKLLRWKIEGVQDDIGWAVSKMEGILTNKIPFFDVVLTSPEGWEEVILADGNLKEAESIINNKQTHLYEGKTCWTDERAETKSSTSLARAESVGEEAIPL